MSSETYIVRHNVDGRKWSHGSDTDCRSCTPPAPRFVSDAEAALAELSLDLRYQIRTLLEQISTFTVSQDHIGHNRGEWDSDCFRCVTEAGFATPLATLRQIRAAEAEARVREGK